MVRLPLVPVCVSDYLFPGETPYDSNDSVEEIFGFKPSIEDFDDELEIVASPGEAMVRRERFTIHSEFYGVSFSGAKASFFAN